jgi:hypothetical protein
MTEVRMVVLSRKYLDGYDSVLLMHLMCVLYKLDITNDIIATINSEISSNRMEQFAQDYLKGNPHTFANPKNSYLKDFDDYY